MKTVFVSLVIDIQAKKISHFILYLWYHVGHLCVYFCISENGITVQICGCQEPGGGGDPQGSPAH